MNQNFHVNKTNFHMKGFALGLALKKNERQLANLDDSILPDSTFTML